MVLTKERISGVVKQLVPEPEAEDIIFYLRGKSNISEFIIAEELDLEIHRTRNLLYKLLDNNIVMFKRKKDKIKGWYICYWDFNEHVILHLEEKLRLQTIAKLKERLASEKSGFFYMCRQAHTRLSFEDAFENDFKCPECGDLMNQLDNKRTIDFLTTRIADLEVEHEEYQSHQQKKLAKIQDELEPGDEPKTIKVLRKKTVKKATKKAAKKTAKKATKKVAKKAKKKAAKKVIKKAVKKSVKNKSAKKK